jgi:hypothetical protein
MIRIGQLQNGDGVERQVSQKFVQCQVFMEFVMEFSSTTEHCL